MHHLLLRDIKGVPKHMIPAAYINGEGTAALKKGYGVRAVSSHRVRFGHKHAGFVVYEENARKHEVNKQGKSVS